MLQTAASGDKHWWLKLAFNHLGLEQHPGTNIPWASLQTGTLALKLPLGLGESATTEALTSLKKPSRKMITGMVCKAKEKSLT